MVLHDCSTPEFPEQLKVIVAGGFGAGKTTFVGAVSEIEPLTTEERLTVASVGTDDLAGVETKQCTTVAMDFGRRTFAENTVLYLFGTPGQSRFWFLWDELCHGATGAVVLVDTRRLQDSFPVVEFFEKRRIPFVVAVNLFDGAYRYPASEVQRALGLGHEIPVVRCDARRGPDARDVLVALIRHILHQLHPLSR